MRMMCIRGRQHDAHTGLFAGQVYDVALVTMCCDPRAEAAGSVFKRGVVLRCSRCGGKAPARRGSPVPWGRDRFAPWSEPEVSQKEVDALYRPSPVKEEVN